MRHIALCTLDQSNKGERKQATADEGEEGEGSQEKVIGEDGWWHGRRHGMYGSRAEMKMKRNKYQWQNGYWWRIIRRSSGDI